MKFAASSEEETSLSSDEDTDDTTQASERRHDREIFATKGQHRAGSLYAFWSEQSQIGGFSRSTS